MANEAYIVAGTSIKVNGEADADVSASVEGTSNGAGAVSAQKDWGAGAKPFIYDWSCECIWQATPTQYGSLDIYLATAPDSDSTQIDGDVGAADAALSDVDQLKNLLPIGSVVVEDADTTKMVASGTFESYSRYHSYVFYNNGGSAINATDSNFIFRITPRHVQIQ